MVGLPLASVVVMWETMSVWTLPSDLVTTVVSTEPGAGLGTVVTMVVGLPFESVVVMWETMSVWTLPSAFVTTVVLSLPSSKADEVMLLEFIFDG